MLMVERMLVGWTRKSRISNISRDILANYWNSTMVFYAFIMATEWNQQTPSRFSEKDGVLECIIVY